MQRMPSMQGPQGAGCGLQPASQQPRGQEADLPGRLGPLLLGGGTDLVIKAPDPRCLLVPEPAPPDRGRHEAQRGQAGIRTWDWLTPKLCPELRRAHPPHWE